MNMTPSHEWLDSILNKPEFRSKCDATVTAADTYMASQLAKNLMELRNQQRSNAYKSIFEARAQVAEDLLALQTSLSKLIHFSAVAGEETKIFVSLQHSVVTVTQKLSMFGEDDVNGDGMRDDQAQSPGQALPSDPATPDAAPVNAPSLDLEIDRAPLAEDNQPEPKADQVLPADQVQTDPADVTDENAVDPTKPKAAPTPSPAHEGENIDGPSELQDPPAEEGAAPAPEGQPADNTGFDTSEDEGDDSDSEEGAEAPEGEDKDSDAAAPEKEEVSEDSDKLHQEFGKLAKKAKKGDGKRGLFESLTEEPEAGAAQASVAEAKDDKTEVKPSFRFVYRGIRGDTVSALITNKVYYYKPTSELFGGDLDQLNVALRQYLEQHPGYTSLLAKMKQLVAAGKLKIVRRVQLSQAQIQKLIHAPEQAHGQLGSVELNEGTSWRYRGLGMDRVRNDSVCLWLEVGDKEYGLVPNPKVFKDKTVEDVDGPIQGKLKKLSYVEGLKFLLQLVHTKKLTPVFEGKIGT